MRFPILSLLALTCLPLLAQSVSELGLEKSTDLQSWQDIFVTPEMVDDRGKIIVPNTDAQQFYRMKVKLLTAPSVQQPPAPSTGIEEGESITLTVDVEGDGLTFQWYQGESGDTSNPISGANDQSYTTGPLDNDTAYWVRVSNSAGSVDSETAVVTINRPPTIIAQPASQTIYAGNTATLNVQATGTAPFTYQWYRGNLGATTAPVGTNSPTFTTPVLTVTTKYWAKISNAFGEIQSNSVTVTVNSTPINMTLIPQGAFTMGDLLDGMSDAPTRTVTLDAFYMGKYEVTKAEWDEVRTWGLSNGFTDLSTGSGKASNHPVHSITWYQMVKWCNARSQKEGLTPVYYTNDEQTTIYKTGDVNVTNTQVRWAANGYRLPTEAEWEKAARGGLSGKRFPWGDTISHSQANYYGSASLSYDSSNGFHPAYVTGSEPYTSPVGAFAANGYGLYDMAGNVWEWCWDGYGPYAEGSQNNPRGSSTGTVRMFRGGIWGGLASGCRVAYRGGETTSDPLVGYLGFRVVRSSAP